MREDLRIPISIGGKNFPSLTIAAKHFDVSPTIIMYYINRGREADFVTRHSTRITINSVRYRSFHRASLATSIPMRTLLAAHRNGRLRALAKVGKENSHGVEG